MDGPTAAAVLGITQGATRDEIRRAFRARAKTAHPDAHGTDEAFVTLRAAADLLLATATAAGATVHCASVHPGGPTPVDVVPGATAMAAAGPGFEAVTGGAGTDLGPGEAHAAVGRRNRWEQRPTARPGPAIDLTDRPAGARAGRAHTAPAAASAAAFARLLEAELARH